jgi:predicted metal-binding membrane protein
MSVLLVVGAMNLLWMVLFAGVIFVEKVAPHGIGVSKALGVLLMAAGVMLAAT